jgi:hypothetical protein
MTRRTLLAFALLTVVIAVLCFWLTNDDQLNARSSAVPQETASVSESSRRVSASAEPSAPPTSEAALTEEERKTLEQMRKIFKSGNDAELPKVTNADVERFLAAKGETPANLLAGWNCTKDRRWLNRAAELHPKNPMVLLALLGAGGPSRSDPELIRRFNEAAPDNPLPKIYEARALFANGDASAAMEVVKEALGRPGFYTWMNESLDAANSLLRFAGVPPMMADMMAMAQIPMPYLTVAQEVSKYVMSGYPTDVSDPISDAGLEMTYQMGQMFTTPEASRTLIGQLVGFSMERRALGELPPDATPRWVSGTPAERLAELDARKTSIPKLVGGIEWALTQNDPALLQQYLSRFRKEGELAALTWIEQQRASKR